MKKYKISTEIASISRLVGRERAIELVAKAGFDAFDLSMFSLIDYDWTRGVFVPTSDKLGGDGYVAYARQLKRIGLDNGIVCNQSHAPFPTSIAGMEKYVLRAIECTAEAGGKICVVHPDNNKNAEQNAEFFLKLLPFARAHGVKIATENMWNWDEKTDRACAAACSGHEDFKRHIDVVGDEYLVACLDIGHAEMMGDDTNAVTMINALGSRLKALHIHDNDRWHDSHRIPFSMKIDFAAIAKALAANGYEGDLTLEADTYLSAFTAETAEEGVKDLAAAAKRFALMVEGGEK